MFPFKSSQERMNDLREKIIEYLSSYEELPWAADHMYDEDMARLVLNTAKGYIRDEEDLSLFKSECFNEARLQPHGDQTEKEFIKNGVEQLLWGVGDRLSLDPTVAQGEEYPVYDRWYPNLFSTCNWPQDVSLEFRNLITGRQLTRDEFFQVYGSDSKFPWHGYRYVPRATVDKDVRVLDKLAWYIRMERRIVETAILGATCVDVCKSDMNEPYMFRSKGYRQPFQLQHEPVFSTDDRAVVQVMIQTTGEVFVRLTSDTWDRQNLYIKEAEEDGYMRQQLLTVITEELNKQVQLQIRPLLWGKQLTATVQDQMQEGMRRNAVLYLHTQLHWSPAKIHAYMGLGVDRIHKIIDEYHQVLADDLGIFDYRGRAPWEPVDHG